MNQRLYIEAEAEEALRANDLGVLLLSKWETRKRDLMHYLGQRSWSKELVTHPDCPSFALHDDPEVLNKAHELIDLGVPATSLEETFRIFAWGILKPFGDYLRSRTGGPRPSFYACDIPESLSVNNGYYDPVRRFTFNLEMARRLAAHTSELQGDTAQSVERLWN